MASVLLWMKIMKENRESIHLKTQENQAECNRFSTNPSNHSLQTFSENDCLSMSQRTKNEDWENIFCLVQKYIEVLSK